MPKIDAKRRVALPIEQCIVANLNAGDVIETFVDRLGVISIVKKQPGAAKGLLKGIATNTKVNEGESLDSGLVK
ncbi:hypothetical protein LRP52_40420 [Photobacterium sp. ZSDE20]|uniref:AbrB family transcriptional regulator n=1 Tax=Photobacterium pectinilyticum TaxID=2906793 RepID=A0ABT1NBQ5_9GAMM|nr:hypothetical protein [Photobacterium sp. ZSDE20]MCQ1060759.1 hypothetical protein [Photobacterium sp. ZSDE20]MDD1828448.1 hypothetical protein [Photobacterium sp. ZSDE20]